MDRSVFDVSLIVMAHRDAHSLDMEQELYWLKTEMVYVRRCIRASWEFPWVCHFMLREFHSLGCLTLALLAKPSPHCPFPIQYTSLKQGLTFPEQSLSVLPPYPPRCLCLVDFVSSLYPPFQLKASPPTGSHSWFSSSHSLSECSGIWTPPHCYTFLLIFCPWLIRNFNGFYLF